MNCVRVVHITPGDWRHKPWGESRQAELERIFGTDVEIIDVSPAGRGPAELIKAVRAFRFDVIVLASAPPPHRRAVSALKLETLILRPVLEEFRTSRGERLERVLGFGVMREHGPELPLCQAVMKPDIAGNY